MPTPGWFSRTAAKPMYAPCGERQHQRGELREPQLRDEPLRTGNGRPRRPGGLPGEAGGERREGDERRCGTLRSRGGQRSRKFERVDVVVARVDRRDHARPARSALSAMRLPQVAIVRQVEPAARPRRTARARCGRYGIGRVDAHARPRLRRCSGARGCRADRCRSAARSGGPGAGRTACRRCASAPRGCDRSGNACW